MSESVVVQKLVAEARKAMEQSYSPYSGFPVGAAVQTIDGRIFRGCNVENAVHSVSICAERSAISSAVSEGHKQFKSMAIVAKLPVGSGDGQQVIVPCGVCRQLMREFSTDLTIYLVRSDNTYDKTSLDVLYPMSFGPHYLLNDNK
ncbi:cytidine deaminase-like [Oppia nitens]|uniref:cytidine deaminase-like n=1 Tax=Oppia nitens TaxID=1686743 RepID=UPI0023DB831C|nr:cytidine deaminase-like [Oppia nitens]